MKPRPANRRYLSVARAARFNLAVNASRAAAAAFRGGRAAFLAAPFFAPRPWDPDPFVMAHLPSTSLAGTSPPRRLEYTLKTGRAGFK